MTIKKINIVDWVTRIKYAMDNIPMGHDSFGTKTIVVQGLVEYQKDMREFKKYYSEFVWYLQDDQKEDCEEMVLKMENISKS